MIQRALLIPLIALMMVQNLSAQKVITGTVKDAEGGGLPGASVAVKDSSIGAITDIDGNFRLEVSEGVLVVSFVGFETQEIEIGNKTFFDITLSTDAKVLDEVAVVAVGYGLEVKKSDLTGSVASVKGEDIAATKTASFMEGMQGRLSGVQITSESGEPGSGVSMVIRGGNSLSGDNQPLYVIDGIQIENNPSEVASGAFGSSATINPLASINPSDIESIEVLKDASATAIYGSRGANGVVLITTKKGASGRVDFTFDGSFGVASQARKLGVLNGRDYGIYRFLEDPQSAVFGYDSDGDERIDSPKDFSDSTEINWQNQALKEAFVRNYTLGVSGGDDGGLRYSSSFGYTDQEGIITSTGLKRYSARVSVNQKVKNYLSIGSMVNYSRNENIGAALNGGNGDFNGIIQSIVLFRPLIIEFPEGEEDRDQLTSPLDLAEEAYKNVLFNRLVGNVYAEMRLGKDFNLRSTLGINASTSKSEEFYSSQTTWGRQVGGRARIANISSENYSFRNILNYKKNFTWKHRFSVQGVWEMERLDNMQSTLEATGFENEVTGINDLSKALNPGVPQTNRTGSSRISAMTRLNYTLVNKYLFTASFRADGSSRFVGQSNRWGYFPSAAFAWKIDQERFLKDNAFLSTAKLRLSSGATGNDRIVTSAAYGQVTGTDYATSTGALQKGLSVTYRSDPNLQWETTWQHDVGLDLGLFEERLQLTADVYYKYTTDLLINNNVSNAIGQAKQWQNVGVIENKGLELALKTINIERSNFLWTTSTNISMNKNRIVSLERLESIPITIGGGYFTSVASLIEGEQLGTAYGYVYDGVYQIEDFESAILATTGEQVPFEEVDWNNRNAYNFQLKETTSGMADRNVRPGDFKYRDLDGNGVIDPNNDRKVISRSNPKHFGGITNDVRYKGIDLSFTFNWSYGNQVFNAARAQYESVFNDQWNLGSDFWNGRWTSENPTNEYAALDNNNSRDVSSYYVEDASFLRLQMVSIGYRLPDKWMDKADINNIRIYATGTNLALWTKYSGFDPEVNFNNLALTGFDRFAYPRAKTVTMGVTVNF